MSTYRRNHVEGGTYFFTVALADRRSDLLVHEIAALRAAVKRTRLRHPFQIDAWVVLPEHLHAVWTLPDGDAAFSLRWTLIKRWFSAAIPPGEARSASRAAKGERAIWPRSGSVASGSTRCATPPISRGTSITSTSTR
jgi:putative transposase